MSKLYSKKKRTLSTCNYCFYEWYRAKGKSCPRCNNKVGGKPTHFYNYKF